MAQPPTPDPVQEMVDSGLETERIAEWAFTWDSRTAQRRRPIWRTIASTLCEARDYYARLKERDPEEWRWMAAEALVGDGWDLKAIAEVHDKAVKDLAYRTRGIVRGYWSTDQLAGFALWWEGLDGYAPLWSDFGTTHAEARENLAREIKENPERARWMVAEALADGGWDIGAINFRNS